MASRAKRKWKYRQNRIQPELKRQLVSTGLWNSDTVVSDVPGEQKMSSVLLDFVAPYTAMAQSEDQFRTAIQIGLIAWNIALLPPEVRKEKVESLIKQAARTGAVQFMGIINEMVERKERYFANCRRWILAHHVMITRRGPHLSVVSTVE